MKNPTNEELLKEIKKLEKQVEELSKKQPIVIYPTYPIPVYPPVCPHPYYHPYWGGGTYVSSPNTVLC